ncbi:hypothetical protein [Streptococcus sp. Marseille-P7375]|uniref:hypothetical protein n=1 Tax=Streptococcus sp. Marseille-P7375 TaxID=2487318 RepID=UPI000A3F3B1C|nr:hypothetical protein [Streptococcus sp. Marseille-P7375]
MKTKTYTKLMAATVLASSLLLGACGHKEETKTSASANKTVQTSSSSKVASSSKASSAPKASSNASSNKTVGQAEQVQKAVESVQPSQNQTQQGVDQQVQSQQNTQAQPSQSQQAPSQQATPTQPTKPTKPNQATQPAQPSQPAQNPATDRQLQNKQAETNARYKGVLNMVDGDFSAAAGSWTDAGGSTVTVSAGGQFSVKSANGTVNTYHVASYAYTLDDGRYTAQLGSADPSAPRLGIQITTGADGKVASVQLIK